MSRSSSPIFSLSPSDAPREWTASRSRRLRAPAAPWRVPSSRAMLQRGRVRRILTDQPFRGRVTAPGKACPLRFVRSQAKRPAECHRPADRGALSGHNHFWGGLRSGQADIGRGRGAVTGTSALLRPRRCRTHDSVRCPSRRSSGEPSPRGHCWIGTIASRFPDPPRRRRAAHRPEWVTLWCRTP